MYNSLKLILDEHLRKEITEGFSAERDDKYKLGELGLAGYGYLQAATLSDLLQSTAPISMHWPWTADWGKPTTRQRNLEKAGGLIEAEINRLYRLRMTNRNCPASRDTTG